MKYLAGINLIQKADTPIHEWYRFVLSDPPHLVRQYIERFGIRGRDLLCDPFAAPAQPWWKRRTSSAGVRARTKED
jgi:hypothetical protein